MANESKAFATDGRRATRGLSFKVTRLSATVASKLLQLGGYESKQRNSFHHLGLSVPQQVSQKGAPTELTFAELKMASLTL